MENCIYKNLFDITGEVAIVTGGLGQLGGEFVKTLIQAGAKVAIFDVKKEPNKKLKTLIDAGHPVSIHEVNLVNATNIVKGFREVKSKFGVPTILINAAGDASVPGASRGDSVPYEEYNEEFWDATINAHLKGAHLMCQEFIRQIRPSRKRGSIINISSTYGMVAPDQSMYEYRRKNGGEFYKPVAYSVAKAGVLNFTRWLAEYCRQRKVPVRVNTLVPGGVLRNHDEKFQAEYGRRTILGRMAKEYEYNAAILFLASHKASSYMTGSTLVIDGGWTAR